MESEAVDAGASVRETLKQSRLVDAPASGSGGRLAASVRQDLEGRFGADLSKVRIHTAGPARALCSQLHSHAVTANGHVFSRTPLNLGDPHSKQLIGHELAHVVQQHPAWRRSSARPARGGESVPIPVSRVAPKTRLQSWKMEGALATSEGTPTDTLGNLAAKFGNPQSWPCLKPVRMKTSEAEPRPAGFDQNYQRFVQRGDVFDVSRLRGTPGSSVSLTLFAPSQPQFTLLNKLYPGTQSSSDVDADLKRLSGEGTTPIRNFVISGHHAGNEIYGGAGRCGPTPLTVPPDQPAPTFGRARGGKLPRRCWFTAFAETRAAGCASDGFAKAFAAIYLRKNSFMWHTTRSIAPGCTNPFQVRPQRFYHQTGLPVCRDDGSGPTIDGLGFVRRSGEALDASAHGPFSTASGFHGSPFWGLVSGRV